MKNEIIVPDQVFLGLMDGTIRGPFINFPKKKAEVSFTKEIATTMNNKSLFINKNSFKVIKKTISMVMKKYFCSFGKRKKQISNEVYMKNKNKWLNIINFDNNKILNEIKKHIEKNKFIILE